jgi:hypothetical protein
MKFSAAVLGLEPRARRRRARAEAPAETDLSGLPAGRDQVPVRPGPERRLLLDRHSQDLERDAGPPHPRRAAPEGAQARRRLEDLQRFSVTVAEGFAWAGSNYRREGYGVRSAAEDSDNLRKLFWNTFGRPKRTVLHGQSWGGNVAAKTAELYGKDADGKLVYDGVILTSGVLGGGTRSYDFRADLRAVYQYYCSNHPEKGEASYPLWQGQPLGSKLTNKQLDERLNACTGSTCRPTSARRSRRASSPISWR